MANLIPAPIPPPSAPPADVEVKELRFALVVYGGVSLAIYMHGFTKELLKLVVASRALEADPAGPNPFDPREVEHAYWEVLDRRRELDGGLVTRVVVDIIAGTSAGGINGVCLAKALARNRTLEPVREVWLDKGDFTTLLWPQRLPLRPLKWLALAGSMLLRRPPLDGRAMLGWIRDALAEMDREPATATVPALRTAPSLVPPEELLELFVPITDFYGFDRDLPTYDPTGLKEKRHRHALRFSFSSNGRDDFAADAPLAFAARATSSFPGAFPPATLGELRKVYRRHAQGLAEFESEQFAVYRLAKPPTELAEAIFVDGGVLDNKPFSLAADAIAGRPASTEVERFLLYVEPDPEGPTRRDPPGGSGPNRAARGLARVLPRRRPRPPGLVKTLLGALSGIPRREPILDDLLDVDARNRRVQRVDDLIRAQERNLQDTVRRVRGEAAGGGDLNALMHEAAERELGLAYDAYLRLKLHGVVQTFGATAATLAGFPPDSSQASFVRDTVLAWAGREGHVLHPGATRREQVAFLAAFDVSYAVRRIFLVVKAVRAGYGAAAGPTRPELDRAKRLLYEHLHRLLVVRRPDHVPAAIREALRHTFHVDAISAAVAGRSPVAAVEAFVGDHAGTLDIVAARLEAHLEGELGRFRDELGQALEQLLASGAWDEDTRQRILARYLGFPLWDALIYPLIKLSDVGELEQVRVTRASPLDVGLLAPPGGVKLKGVGVHHFGAFFGRDRRENDYLWGRLDGAERLVQLLLRQTPTPLPAGRPPSPHHAAAFRAILAEERDRLGHRRTRALCERLERQAQAFTA